MADKPDFPDGMDELMRMVERTSRGPLGATDRFPEGGLSEADEGELALVIGCDKETRRVFINFGKPIKWIAFDRDKALAFAKAIEMYAEKLPGK